MTNIKILKKAKKIASVEIIGHTNYENIGKDIVCASISSIVTTTVNAILRINSHAIDYQVEDGYCMITVLLHDQYTDILMINMIELFQQLAQEYQKNVKINI